MSKRCFLCCNKCFESNADVQLDFFVTNCYHIFCAGCLTNNQNFCIVCNKKCKLLLIDANLPKEVKSYFDLNSHQHLLQTAVKIQDFQQVQVKNYVNVQYEHRKTYFECKQKITDSQNTKKQIIEGIKRERSIIEKLKEAFHSNIITPELFQMRSPNTDSTQSIPSPKKTNFSVESEETSSSQSTSSFFINQKTQLDSNGATNDLTMSPNFNKGSQATQKSMTGTKNNLIKEARKGLVAQTIRNINQGSQSQAHGSQLRPSEF